MKHLMLALMLSHPLPLLPPTPMMVSVSEEGFVNPDPNAPFYASRTTCKVWALEVIDYLRKQKVIGKTQTVAFRYHCENET